MLFGRDKKKEAQAQKPAQYSQHPQAYTSKATAPYSQDSSSRSSGNQYPPVAPPNQMYIRREQATTARPGRTSGPSYAEAPQQRPPPQYATPIPYRPVKRQQKRFIPKKLAPPPVMMPGMRYTDSNVRLLSKRLYEDQAREDAWDRGLREYIHARDNNLPYAGNSSYGSYVNSGPMAHPAGHQGKGGNGRRY